MIIAESNQPSGYKEIFERFQKTRSRDLPTWLRDARGQAFTRFLDLGFPTTRDEAWRFTNIKPIAQQSFALAEPSTTTDVSSVLHPSALSDDFHRRVFVNGHLASQSSSTASLPAGVIIGNLAQQLAYPTADLQSELNRRADLQQAPFTALNTAFLEDGALVSIPRGTILEQPIELIFVTDSKRSACMSHPRNLYLFGAGSQATIIERYVGTDGQPYLNNVVTEAVLGEGACLDHYKLQQEDRQGYHIASLNVHQSQDSVFCSNYFSVGSALARNEIACDLDGENIECLLNGVYLASGHQQMDNRTRVEHAKPNCHSSELYKGILDDHAKGVFNGRINVHQDAQKTDAKQSNQVMLLSDDAVVDTQPQLEIYADDVKCTHGSTVGELDEKAMHYLRSRGIPAELAKSMLVFAFANEVVQHVKLKPVRSHLKDLLLADRHLPEL